MREPENLAQCLQRFFTHIIPAVAGDPAAIERIAYELCEFQAANRVAYFETRYCPHLLANTIVDPQINHHTHKSDGPVSPEMVVQLINRGLERGMRDFRVEARSILACIRGHPDWSNEILNYCETYRDQGVVGIDVAGVAHGYHEGMTDAIFQIFQEANRRNIHRTVHAGEAGTAKDVESAVEFLCAERIGHGYHVIDDDMIYRTMLAKQMHFEVCPTSSYLTGSMKCAWHQHPAIKFMKDGANFGLNSDDPTVFGNSISFEIQVAKDRFGFTNENIKQLQINAANAAFISEHDRKGLVKHIKAIKDD